MSFQKRCRPRGRAEKIQYCYNCIDSKLHHKIEGKWWCTNCYANDRPTGKKTKNASAK